MTRAMGDDEGPVEFLSGMKVTARKVYTIEFSGPEEEYVKVAHELMLSETQEGLDSMDAGDATGAFISLAESKTHFEEWGSIMFEARGYRVTIAQAWDRFEYTGEWK